MFSSHLHRTLAGAAAQRDSPGDGREPCTQVSGVAGRALQRPARGFLHEVVGPVGIADQLAGEPTQIRVVLVQRIADAAASSEDISPKSSLRTSTPSLPRHQSASTVRG